MKPGGIQRAVRAHRHERSVGDAPNLGRVARIGGGEMSKSGSHRQKRGERGSRGGRNVVLNWSILFGVLAVISLGAAIYFWLRPQIDLAGPARPESIKDPDESVRVRSQFPSPGEKEALDLVSRALSVRAPEEVAARFHLASTAPAEVVGFLRNIEASDGVFDHSEWLNSMDANGLSIDGVLVYFKKGDKLRQRIAFLTPDDKGVWKLDFDAFARTVKPSWNELLEQHADEAVVRVVLAEDSYFNGPFQDDTQWTCYGMGSPDIETVLLGYCRVDSPQDLSIKSMSSKGSKIVRATVKIRRVEGGSPRQFEIVQVLAEDWVMGKTPFEDGFK